MNIWFPQKNEKGMNIMAFTNEKYRIKLNNRIRKLVNRHERYLKGMKEATSEKKVAAMQEGLFLIEEELCFLLSFLADTELDRFYSYTNVQWTDEIEFENNRPKLIIPLA